MSWRSVALDDEQYNYEYFFKSDNICRICWCQNASIELSNIDENVKNGLFDKINCCLEMTLTQFDYLNKICADCNNEIENFYEFKIFCRESDIKFRKILETGCNAEQAVVKIELPNLELDNEPFENFYEDQAFCIESKPIIKKVKVEKEIKYAKSDVYCNVCCLNLENKEKLSSHNSEVHGIEENGTLFKCYGCEKRFKTRKTRVGHEQRHCIGLKDGYRCVVCERCLPNRKMYQMHMKDHLHNLNIDLPEEIFKCRKCLKVFKTKQCLKKHNSFEHGDSLKKFVCDMCGRVFTRQDYLYKHKLTHTGVKRYSCPHCEFKATQRSSLTVHIRKHTGEKPFSCDLCPQKCISSSNLKAHRQKHLGSKRYECMICNKTFGYKMSLEEHISCNHERTEIHTCEHCGVTYTRLRGLKRHLAAKHKTKDDRTLPTQVIECANGKLNDAAKVQYELKEEDLLLIKNTDEEFIV